MQQTKKRARRTPRVRDLAPIAVEPGKLYTTIEAAQFLRRHPDTVKGLPIPRKRESYRKVLYKGQDLIAYVERLPSV